MGQQQTLTTPFAIDAGATYVVPVNTGNSYYVDTLQGVASQIVSGSLRAIAGHNGVFGSVVAFPTSSYQNSNYFPDVIFVRDNRYLALDRYDFANGRSFESAAEADRLCVPA